MKIGQKPDIPSALPQTGLAKQAKSPASAAQEAAKGALTTSAAGVPVTVSSAARALEQTARTTGDFDAGKVKAVGMSDAQLYKQAGNAVTTNVVEAVARIILETEKGENA